MSAAAPERERKLATASAFSAACKNLPGETFGFISGGDACHGRELLNRAGWESWIASFPRHDDLARWDFCYAAPNYYAYFTTAAADYGKTCVQLYGSAISTLSREAWEAGAGMDSWEGGVQDVYVSTPEPTPTPTPTPTPPPSCTASCDQADVVAAIDALRSDLSGDLDAAQAARLDGVEVLRQIRSRLGAGEGAESTTAQLATANDLLRQLATEGMPAPSSTDPVELDEASLVRLTSPVVDGNATVRGSLWFLIGLGVITLPCYLLARAVMPRA